MLNGPWKKIKYAYQKVNKDQETGPDRSLALSVM